MATLSVLNEKVEQFRSCSIVYLTDCTPTSGHQGICQLCIGNANVTRALERRRLELHVHCHNYIILSRCFIVVGQA